MSAAARRAGAGALLLALAGCGLFAEEQAPRPCPDAVMLADARRITVYRPGPGRDLTDVKFAGEIAQIAGVCSYDDDELTATLIVDIVATRGPAATGDEPAVLPFFVAIADETENVIAKQVFESAIPIPEGRRRAGVREEIEQVIPLDEDAPAPYYQIVVGFQLTHEQLEQNRRARGG